MEATERELWLLNFYRNSELHGALLMGRLARTLGDSALLVHATRHCATEARHAAILSETIAALGGRVDPHVPTVQEHYSRRGGVPTSLVDLLVVSEILEKRVLATYREHVSRADIPRAVERSLREIVRDMEGEEHGDHEGWIEQALAAQPRDLVEAADRKWRAVDAAVVDELQRHVAARFPASGSTS